MITGGEIAKVIPEIAEGLGKTGVEKPGAGFDGPWNNVGTDIGKEAEKGAQSQIKSSFDGPWNRGEENIERGFNNSRTGSDFDGSWNNQHERSQSEYDAIDNKEKIDIRQEGGKYNDEVGDKAIGNNKEINVDDWEKVGPEEYAERKKEFAGNKDEIIEGWEKNNDQKWPTYKTDVHTKSGKLLRRAGDRYDAHHIQPLEFGGKNTADNIAPMHASDHHDKQGIHRPNGPYDKIANSLRH